MMSYFFKVKKYYYKTGFSVIELVVVISILAILLVTVTNVMISTFRARNRADIGDKLEQNGQAALEAIRSNLLNSNGINVTCPVSVGTSISFEDRQDGAVTRLECNEGAAIASISASLNPMVTTPLTSADVYVQECSTFVECVESVPGILSEANIKFVLNTTTMPNLGIADTMSRTFETKVVIRN